MTEVFGYVVHHPDGVVLVDTGMGSDNEFLDELYAPKTVDIVSALNERGIDERDVVAVMNTHLHFDHCGQNRRFLGTPIYVQAAELEAAAQPLFTVVEWATIPEADRRTIDGDEVIATGLTIAATPGHTPGHQALIIDAAGDVSIIAGQCGYCAAEFAAGVVPLSEVHDENWLEVGRRSLARLRGLQPRAAYFSHDATTYSATHR